MATVVTYPVILSQYPESNKDEDKSIGLSFGTPCGQSFQGKIAELDSVTFYLKKTGSPTGNAVAKLYSHTGSFGVSSVNGSLLATSDIIDVSTLTTTYQLITFKFSGTERYIMADRVFYVIGLDYNAGDATNFVSIGRDTSTPKHVGNSCFNGAANAGQDVCFYLWAIVPPRNFTKLRPNFHVGNGMSVTRK
jgi:hypothetical protein